MAEGYTNVFSAFQKYIETEQDLREEIRAIVRDIDRGAREILTVLQAVHQPKGLTEIPQLCQKARECYTNIQNNYKLLTEKVPHDQYYRYNDHWKYVTQRLVFMAAFIIFLETGKLLERDDAAKFLGICAVASDGFHIDLEDFLMGLLHLADEMSRFAVNCVTSGDYERPVQIAQFVTEMNAGFRLLNLKNDMLRKKFDSLKYNIKKIEEVVYDLSIRGLKPADGDSGVTPTLEA